MASLAGKRILLTRPATQCQALVEQIEAYGGNPICLPVIEIAPPTSYAKLDEAILEIETFDWLILTSANGVKGLSARLHYHNLNLSPSLKIACIGEKTASAAKNHGMTPDAVPEKYVGEAIFHTLGDVQGKRFLLVRAEIARQALPEMIVDAGGIVVDTPVYRTIPADVSPAALAELHQGVDVLTFTSPSTVQYFNAILEANQLDFQAYATQTLIACIGPITAAAVEEFNLKVDIMPDVYTAEKMIIAIETYFQLERVNL